MRCIVVSSHMHGVGKLPPAARVLHLVRKPSLCMQANDVPSCGEDSGASMEATQHDSQIYALCNMPGQHPIAQNSSSRGTALVPEEDE